MGEMGNGQGSFLTGGGVHVRGTVHHYSHELL